MIIKQIEYNSLEYLKELDLRYKVLRKPLGLHYTQEQLKMEINDFHFIALEKDNVVGCLLLRPLDKKRVQMRQVAVDDYSQGKGIGRKLVEFCELFALEHQFCEIVLHARDVAVPFYEKLGYIKVGDLFYEVTIPHYEMMKILSHFE